MRSASGDPRIVDQVLELLGEKRDHASNSSLDETAVEGPAAECETPQDEVVGDRVQSTATGELLQKLESAPKLDKQRYTLEGELGKGGMGIVLGIHDHYLNRRLAMKVMLQRPAPRSEEEARLLRQLLGRFLEEAQVTSQLDHPGVVAVHELGLDQSGRVYFTMRMVKGRTASEVFADALVGRNDWTLTRALEVVLKVCDTMAYAHDKGVIHRDLKPSNVMIGRFGEVYVMDWGLAKVIGQPDRHDLRIHPVESSAVSRLVTARMQDAEIGALASVVTLDGQQLGTPHYMSPEQASSEELDQRADVYSIGAMIYELLTGRAPYAVPGLRIDAYKILREVVEGSPKRIEDIRSGVPAELVAIAEMAMARKREQRYASVQDLAADLRAFLAQRVVQAYRTGALVEMRLWVRRNKSLAGSIAAAMLLLVLGIAISTSLARSNASLAVEKSALAEQASANEARAAYQSYLVAIQAADQALRYDDPWEARRALDRAPAEHRGWEWQVLTAQLDTSFRSFALPPVPADESPGHVELRFDRSERKIFALVDGQLFAWEVRAPSTPTRFAIPEHDILDYAETAAGELIALCAVQEEAEAEEAPPLEVWSLRDGRRLDIIHEGERTLGEALSPDGRWLLLANADGALLRDVSTKSDLPLHLSGRRFRDAWFSPNSAFLLLRTADDEHASVMSTISLTDGRVVASFARSSVADQSGDRSTVAIDNEGKTVSIVKQHRGDWDSSASIEVVATADGHRLTGFPLDSRDLDDSTLSAAAWDPVADALLLCDYDGSVALLPRTADGPTARTALRRPQRGGPRGIEVSDGSGRFVTYGGEPDNRIFLGDLATPRRRLTLLAGNPGPVDALCISSSGAFIAAISRRQEPQGESRTLQLWSSEAMDSSLVADARVDCAVRDVLGSRDLMSYLEPDVVVGRTLVAKSADSGYRIVDRFTRRLRLDLGPGDLQARFSSEAPVRFFGTVGGRAFDPLRCMEVPMRMSDQVRHALSDGWMRICSAQERCVIVEIEGPGIRSFRFDGTRADALGDSRAGGEILAVSFSPDEAHLAALRVGGSLSVRRVADLSQEFEWQLGEVSGLVSAMTWTSGSRRLFVELETPPRSAVLDLVSGRRLADLGGRVVSGARSFPDLVLLRTPDRARTLLVDPTSGKTICSAPSSDRRETSADLSPDGSRVAFVLPTGVVDIHDARNGEKLLTIESPEEGTSPLLGVRFSNSGDILFLEYQDKTYLVDTCSAAQRSEQILLVQDAEAAAEAALRKPLSEADLNQAEDLLSDCRSAGDEIAIRARFDVIARAIRVAELKAREKVSHLWNVGRTARQMRELVESWPGRLERSTAARLMANADASERAELRQMLSVLTQPSTDLGADDFAALQETLAGHLGGESPRWEWRIVQALVQLRHDDAAGALATIRTLQERVLGENGSDSVVELMSKTFARDAADSGTGEASSPRAASGDLLDDLEAAGQIHGIREFGALFLGEEIAAAALLRTGRRAEAIAKLRNLCPTCIARFLPRTPPKELLDEEVQTLLRR
ncbi:MAG: WD40 repeat domain-containing serine/threonine protein kinase [Planctomycetota bacterium]